MFAGLPGGPHPVMTDSVCGVGRTRLLCPFSLDLIHRPALCMSICVPIADPGQGCVCRGVPGHRTPGPSWRSLSQGRHETWPLCFLPPLPPLGQEGLAERWGGKLN